MKEKHTYQGLGQPFELNNPVPRDIAEFTSCNVFALVSLHLYCLEEGLGCTQEHSF